MPKRSRNDVLVSRSCRRAARSGDRVLPSWHHMLRRTLASRPSQSPPTIALASRPPATCQENLRKCGYSTPTPVQRFAIPCGLVGRDVMVCAQTGSGNAWGSRPGGGVEAGSHWRYPWASGGQLGMVNSLRALCARALAGVARAQAFCMDRPLIMKDLHLHSAGQHHATIDVVGSPGARFKRRRIVQLSSCIIWRGDIVGAISRESQ